MEDYKNAQSFEDAKLFWRRHLSGDKFDGYLQEIESLVPDLSASERKELVEWRRECTSRLSQLVHPSYLAAATSTYMPSVREHKHLKPAMLGVCSWTSIVT